MNKTNDIFLNMLPVLDLHGYTKDEARVSTNDFILENKLQGKYEVIIIHGIGEGIVKNSVKQTLDKNNLVLEHNIMSSNIGCTIVKIKH